MDDGDGADIVVGVPGAAAVVNFEIPLLATAENEDDDKDNGWPTTPEGDLAE